VSKYSSFRVSTLNLDHFDDDRLARLSAAASAVERHRSDVVLLQEVCDIGGTDSASRLADMLGMTMVVRSDAGNAILSRPNVSDPQIVQLSTGRRNAGYGRRAPSDAATAVVDLGCHRFLMVSTHLSWGSGREDVRLAETLALDAWVSERAPLDPQRDAPELYAVLGGDLNSEPSAASVRWLNGLDVQDGRSTLWVDAWRFGMGAGSTSTLSNPFSGRTAATVGIVRPDQLPDRRIDYLFSRGYAFGRTGAFIEAELLGDGPGEAFGDHYGVGATVLC
jgi:endonuclease/exonuclease/phosphatase family metal-dependent hydrolase